MPLLWVSTAFLIGLVLAAWQPVHWGIWGAVAVCCVLLGILEQRTQLEPAFFRKWRKISPLPLGVVLAALFLGAMRYQLAQPTWTPEDLAWYNDSGKAVITGQLIAPPDTRDRTVLLQIRALEIKQTDSPSNISHPVSGHLLAKLPTGKNFQYGDIITLEGKPITPPENEDFSYKDYLARQGVYTYITYPYATLVKHGHGNLFLRAVYNLRDAAYNRINRFLPQPEASLLAGILLGIETDIPDSVELAFQNTGTTHIIAISGFNIAILAGLFTTFAGRIFSQRWAPLAAMLGISAYTVLVGAQPPVVRAAIMGGIGLFGRQIGRRQSGTNTLAFTAAVMALCNPLILWDAGFQLSFAATLGLILFADPMHDWFLNLAERWFSERTAQLLAGPVSEYLLFTLAAQLTTLPVIAYHFERISISALLANPLILPPQPLIMFVGGIAVLVGLIIPPLGQLLSYLVWPILSYTIRMVELLARIPHGSIVMGNISLLLVVFFYVLLFGSFLAAKQPKEKKQWLKPAAMLMALLLITTVIWQAALVRPDGNLHLTILNVDNGPAVFIQSPDGHAVLLNGGSSGRQLSDQLGRRLPIFSRNLDAFILTNTASASLQGLSTTLDRFPPEQVFWHSEPTDCAAGRRLSDQLYGANIPLQTMQEGESLSLGDGVRLSILAHTEQGTALLLEWKNCRILLPGSVYLGTIVWKGGDQLQNLTGLILSETDLEEQPIETWLDLAPLVFISPVLNVPNTPNPICLSEHNWIELTTDGSQLWVEVDK